MPPKKKARRPKDKRKKPAPKRKRDGGRRAAFAIREAISTAIGQDRELMGELSDPERERTGKGRAGNAFLQTAEALEPILADAVRKRPSFLGRVAYGTAQLVTTLASEDKSSGKRLTEIAGGSHVGLVFIDVVGFTSFTASNGDEAAVELVQRLESLVSDACRRFEGEVVKHLGDGFLLAFSSASRAVRGALALRDAARKERASDPTFQMVRISVHAGRPSVVEDDLIGHDVNLTARLLEHAKPGGVIVSEEAKRLAEGRLKSVRFSEAGQVMGKGLPEPVTTYVADAI